ncbi:hypothetical protein D9M69_437630 [compost metagenome]
MPRQTVPPLSLIESMACWMVAAPLLWPSALTHTLQSQPSPSAIGGQSTRQSVSPAGKFTTARRA